MAKPEKFSQICEIFVKERSNPNCGCGIRGDSITHQRTAPLSCAGLYRMEPVRRITLIRSGIPADFAQRLLRSLDNKRIGLGNILKITDQSLTRLASADRLLSQSASERIVEVAMLVGQVEVMVEESGTLEGFDSAESLSKWLGQPVPALDNRRPVTYLDTIKGARLVSEMLGKMQSGAYT